MSKEIVKKYSNGEVKVIWKPSVCVHSGMCVKGLPEVFRPKEKPWIKIDAAISNQIMRTVEKCPSGVLSYEIKDEKVSESKINLPENLTRIEAMKNGPLVIFGEIEIKNSDGQTKKSSAAITALCRCGASKDRPFCDGSHLEIKFKG